MFDKMRGQPHFSCLILKTELAPVAYLDSLTWWGINRRAKRAGKCLLINIHEGVINSKLMFSSFCTVIGHSSRRR